MSDLLAASTLNLRSSFLLDFIRIMSFGHHQVKVLLTSQWQQMFLPAFIGI